MDVSNRHIISPETRISYSAECVEGVVSEVRLRPFLGSSPGGWRSRVGKVSPAEPIQDLCRHLLNRTVVRDRRLLDADPDGARHPRGRFAQVLSPARSRVGAEDRK